MAGRFKYTMVQIPAAFSAIPSEAKTIAAKTLEELVDRYSRSGWEFFRMDPFLLDERPGCLDRLFGSRDKRYDTYVVTFRFENTSWATKPKPMPDGRERIG